MIVSRRLHLHTVNTSCIFCGRFSNHNRPRDSCTYRHSGGSDSNRRLSLRPILLAGHLGLVLLLGLLLVTNPLPNRSFRRHACRSRKLLLRRLTLLHRSLHHRKLLHWRRWLLHQLLHILVVLHPCIKIVVPHKGRRIRWLHPWC